MWYPDLWNCLPGLLLFFHLLRWLWFAVSSQSPLIAHAQLFCRQSLSSSPGCPASTPGVHCSHLSQTWSLHSPLTVPIPRLCTPLCLLLVLVTWNIYEEMHGEVIRFLIFIVLSCLLSKAPKYQRIQKYASWTGKVWNHNYEYLIQHL